MDFIKWILVNIVLIVIIGGVYALPLSIGINYVTAIISIVGIIFLVFNFKTLLSG